MLTNGVFAAAEIAVVSLRSSRLDALVGEGNRAAQRVKRLRDNPERFLATVQIGITIVGAVAAAFGGANLARRFEPVIRELPLVGAQASVISLGLVVALISYLSLILGELVPKSLALRYAEHYALVISGPLLTLSWLARPIVWFLTASSNVVLKLFGDSTTFTESRLSPDELRQLVDEATKTGSVDPRAGEIAARAFDFAELLAAHVMVPRSRVVGLPRGSSLEDLQRVALEKGHTRMPVYEGVLDNVVGYVSVKDIMAMSWGKGPHALAEIIRPAYFVGETMRAVALLNEMRRRRTPMAIVVDERGVMAGLVTIEDLVEELVGEIFNEHDAPAPECIRQEAKGVYLVDGEVPVRDLNRELDLDLPEGEAWSTVAGLCLYLSGKIPRKGERIETPDKTMLEIADATHRKVLAVRVCTRKREEEADKEEG